MQLEANDLRTAKRILVKLVEEALLEYEQNLAELDEPSNTDGHLNHLILQLKALLGEVLVEALGILDEQSIQLYSYDNSEIAEIQIKRQQHTNTFWLFPRVNYCTCDQFKEGVLGVADQLQTVSSTPSSEKLKNRYTCAHVLALRLAQVLRPAPLTFKVEAVTKQQFKNLQDRMYCSYLDVFKEGLG
ncbi:uncharacterized protein LOC128857230 [Anastrepha ludens]|uniref:uncharacterized protein LOC128857230 n=1 Tax=Anastrepha ludens TaxID=28586 RepID=UPI0023AF8C32|nr:uncharacterized protein LOC128857230 [Anastrepha ludens]